MAVAKSKPAPKRRGMLPRVQALAVGNAVQGLHAICRMASMTMMEIPCADGETGDAEALVIAIRDVAQKHGESLDAVLRAVSPTGATGLFDSIESETDETARDSKENAHV